MQADNNQLSELWVFQCSLFLINFQFHTQAVLSVADCGRGFDPGKHAAGDGIENMHHRAGQLKGTLLLESRPDEGTRLVLKVPTP